MKERWVRVQAGVVKDQLNRFLKPHGLSFLRNFPPVIVPHWAE